MLLSNWTKNKKNRYFEAANGGEWQRPVKRKILPKMKLHYEYYSPHSVKTLNVKLDRKQYFDNGKWERIRGWWKIQPKLQLYILSSFCFILFVYICYWPNALQCSCIFRLCFFFFFSCSSIFLCGEVFQKIFLFRISNTTVAKNKENWRVTIFKLREDFNHGITMHCNGKQII